ncbi:MAG: hypothetical protein COS71_01425 [Candidatus Moranbacteria bacterium CG06_land_8_20_14_3_00_40_12]|nr:MAG: hypothetical protein COX31_01535 [Candidatus Moranbacteria bacterium CG23_combo_of_CG06-09_8_20_14_all_40_16]PIU80814.1 MAG: hypothetical protein COS71_01425 [Candidatus Moranbacteria bacterium CG06_land_8_20_14_3_00_40_12]
MLVVIISDIHDNIPNLTKVLAYCRENEIKKIICCGDLASMETLDFSNDNFQGEIFYTFGNMDNDFLKDYFFEKLDPSTSCLAGRQALGMTYKKTKIFKNFGEAEFENTKVAFVHFPWEAEELCRMGKYQFVFYGHTHKPFEEIINECKMLNPGNVANQIYPPTFAVWNTEDDEFGLVRINGLK